MEKAACKPEYMAFWNFGAPPLYLTLVRSAYAYDALGRRTLARDGVNWFAYVNSDPAETQGASVTKLE